MFELLDNPEVPPVTAGDRAAVARAGRARLARRRLILGGSMAGTLVVLGTLAFASSQSGDPPSLVDATTSETTATTVTASTTMTPTTTSAVETSPSTTAISTTTTTASTTIPTASTTTTTPKTEPRATRSGEPSVPPRAGVTLTLRLDRTVVSGDDKLPATLRLVNKSSREVTVTHKCSGYHFGLYRDGEWVGGTATWGCTGDVAPVPVAPGETYEVEIEFDTFGPQSYSGRREPLPRGIYQAAGGFYVDEDESLQAWFTPAVDVEIR